MGITEVILQHKRVMFDTVPIIYFIEGNQAYGKVTNELFKLVLHNHQYHAFSSIISLIEVITKPLRDGHIDIIEKYRNFLLHSKNFFIIL